VFTFIETRLFTRLVLKHLSDEHYAEMQMALVANPELGPVIPKTGGARKLRWAAQGRYLDADHVPEECGRFHSCPCASRNS
jgi:hypothetical protein